MSEQQYNIMTEFAYLVQSTFPTLPFLDPDLDDTTLVVLGTGVIDEFLKLVLVAGFMQQAVSKRRVTEVFGNDGALGTFSAKISLATLLGLMTDDAAHDLKILRKIRNSFAHTYKRLQLNEFSICLSLRLAPKLEIIDSIIERRKFKQSCAAIIGILSTATMIRNAQYRFISNNSDGVQKEYEAMVKEAEGIAAPLRSE
jgi:DNA-binding MltR family transcriptional regulator